MYDLYKSWEEASCHDFVSFWNGAGIEDEEVLVLLPHVKSTEVVFFWQFIVFLQFSSAKEFILRGCSLLMIACCSGFKY